MRVRGSFSLGNKEQIATLTGIWLSNVSMGFYINVTTLHIVK